MRLRGGPAGLVLALGCAPAVDDRPGGAVDDTLVDATDPPAETDPVETDAADSVVGPDDSAPRDSDPVDTEVAASPPVDWGGAMIEVAGPLWAARALVVDPGDATVPRPHQDTVTFFGDVDSDGRDDVVVAAVPTGTEPGAWEGRVLRFTPTGVVEDAALGAAITLGADPPRAAVDLDGDGYTDLLGGGAHQAVRWGTGSGRFGPWVVLGHDGMDGTALRGGAVGLLDVDADGWLDLVFGSWGCVRPGWVALRTGARSFVLRDDLLVGTTADAFAVLGTVLDDGRPLVHLVDNACSAADPTPRTLRPVGLTADGLPRFEPVDPAPQDAWWKLLPEHAGRSFDTIAPMGSGVDDLDGDGVLDLVVSIGIAPQVLLRGLGDGTFEDRGGFGSYVRPSGPGYPEFPWGVGFPDVDQDGRPEIAWAVGDDAGSFMVEHGHPMRPAVSWNAGDFRFVDVQDAIGLTTEGSWHALAVGDPDADGDADLAVGGDGNPPSVYRNDLDVDGRHGVTLRLRGSTSNRLAIGARVEAHVAGLPVRTTVVGATASPGGTTAPAVILGTGSSQKVDLLRVRWPSGHVQEVVDLPVDAVYLIEEPPTIEVLDGDRRTRADGTSTVTVRVTPRTPDGAPDPGATVAVRFDGTQPTIDVPLAPRSGVWTVRLRAPDAPGWTVVRVTIDGVDAGIAPRLTWTAP